MARFLTLNVYSFMDDRYAAMPKNHNSTAKYINHWTNGNIRDDFISNIALGEKRENKYYYGC